MAEDPGVIGTDCTTCRIVYNNVASSVRVNLLVDRCGPTDAASDQFDYYETEMLWDDEDLTHNIFVKIKFNVTDME
ncbi:hypothetical protein CVT25_006935 [Psilocybe cyanescens]|uniref:Uncharacterized protein n=1 Tax=Psilocybe cyanescens TaxID=93625 RepID=A0A409X632_PSICY|nr:hypothetical protein CVT25_006935 [Psilocybe cyanescens]